MKKKPKKPPTPLKRMVGEMVEKGHINWPRDMKMAKKLLEMFPNNDFWFKVTFPDKYWSLAYFLTEEGLTDIQKKLAEFQFEIPASESYNIDDKKYGEDREIDLKPKSRMDFLR